MRAAVLFSGGKDSTIALFEAKRKGVEIGYLVSLIPKRSDSYMFHYPNIGLTKVQAALMGIPIITKETKGEKERELKDLKEALGSIGDKIDSVISGAIASEYQKTRVDKICKKLGYESLAPLWHMDPLDLWRMCLDNSFKVMITAVACDGLGKGWLGRIIDEENLKELVMLSERYSFHLGGEGGEFETLVVDCPMFKKPLDTEKKKLEWDEKTDSGSLIIAESV